MEFLKNPCVFDENQILDLDRLTDYPKISQKSTRIRSMTRACEMRFDQKVVGHQQRKYEIFFAPHDPASPLPNSWNSPRVIFFD